MTAHLTRTTGHGTPEASAYVHSGEKTQAFLRAAVGDGIVLAAAAAVAITLLVLPAPDRPAPIAGPLTGHSLLHFPR
jgi:hypothetical protein